MRALHSLEYYWGTKITSSPKIMDIVIVESNSNASCSREFVCNLRHAVVVSRQKLYHKLEITAVKCMTQRGHQSCASPYLTTARDRTETNEHTKATAHRQLEVQVR